MPTLTAEQVAQYEHDGYLAPIRLFEDHELDPLRAHVDKLVAGLPEGGRPEGLDMLHPNDPFLLEWLTQPRILDLVEPLLGPDIVLWASHFICKPKGEGRAVPWHQDSAYWALENMRVVTVWLAVDPSTPENGCMRVIPGSHRVGNLGHQRLENAGDFVLPLETDRSAFSEDDAVDIVLRPGEVSLHDAFLLHGSNPNHSPNRRCGYTMRYMPVTTRLDRERSPHHPLFLARGEDRDGINDYVPLPVP